MPISDSQWWTIASRGLGLRSESNADIIYSAASYSMDCGKTGSEILRGTPGNWDECLRNTIEFIKGFPEADNRYLLIVEGSRGDSFEYSGCFPKCSSKPRGILASTSLNASVDELFKWVLNSIDKL
ncbi:hypothetical protein [Xanthovirga aplysinae]|uniref:hypothetical protein n=1 Tax=Xanthovirga aplysinae TaxID=2529853 RepID=UPI0012BCAF45|nr:hypothetical protein [Xanthovirga aplysinae]MTI31115.1 hypothetical protein [Xanthovirga aplysinae]